MSDTIKKYFDDVLSNSPLTMPDLLNVIDIIISIPLCKIYYEDELSMNEKVKILETSDTPEIIAKFMSSDNGFDEGQFKWYMSEILNKREEFYQKNKKSLLKVSEKFINVDFLLNHSKQDFFIKDCMEYGDGFKDKIIEKLRFSDDFESIYFNDLLKWGNLLDLVGESIIKKAKQKMTMKEVNKMCFSLFAITELKNFTENDTNIYFSKVNDILKENNVLLKNTIKNESSDFIFNLDKTVLKYILNLPDEEGVLDELYLKAIDQKNNENSHVKEKVIKKFIERDRNTIKESIKKDKIKENDKQKKRI